MVYFIHFLFENLRIGLRLFIGGFVRPYYFLSTSVYNPFIFLFGIVAVLDMPYIISNVNAKAIDYSIAFLVSIKIEHIALITTRRVYSSSTMLIFSST